VPQQSQVTRTASRKKTGEESKRIGKGSEPKTSEISTERRDGKSIRNPLKMKFQRNIAKKVLTKIDNN
jgi:hypothetical protein